MYHAEERVEFFQSESSFNSDSSLSNSRYFDFTNDIIAETDSLFLTLKKQLLPNEQLSQQDKVKYALSRAQILYKDTIPEHLAYLNKIQAPPNALNQVLSCSEKLKKLLSDYEALKSKTMIYKQFFNIYGKEFGYNPEGSFVKGERVLCVQDENQAVLKPECIQINYNGSRAKLKATPRVFMAANPPQTDKQVASLREEVYLLKKNIEDMKKKHDLEITNEKLLTEKRIRTYLKAPLGNEKGEEVRSEIEQYSFKLSCSEEENRSLKELVEENRKAIETLKSENNSLKEEVEMLRKRDINMEEENVHDKSYTSQVNEKDERRLEKKLKILLHENELLKNQLKAQRQKLYRLSSDLTDQEKKELDRLKKLFEKKTHELEELYSNLDKQRIQILQLSHNNKALTKMNEAIKNQNQEIKRQLKTVSKEPAISLPPLPLVNDLQVSLNMSRKLQVLEYEGEGVQGLPYYEILSKEFKIRFRRACLKDKQLLHKANGLEIGVISQFNKPNKIDMLLHLTNYGESVFKKVKGKMLNANDNKIEGQVFQYAELTPGDQLKIPVSLIINHYPLGPLILALEYQADKWEELRVLLPAHIFKMMEFQERLEPIKNPERVHLATERKIAKGIEEIRQYLKGGRLQEGCLKLSGFHRHTHTEVHLDILQGKDGIDLCYQHYEGNANITEYFIKTFAFLLKK